MDEEIQSLMQELLLRRTQEKDFKSLEDQIRCLRTRFDALGKDHSDISQEQSTKESRRQK